MRSTSAKYSFGPSAAPRKNPWRGWLAAPLLAAGLAGCGPAAETTAAAPQATVVAPPPTPVVAVSPATAATPPAPTIETKVPPASSTPRPRAARPAAPEPLEAAPVAEALPVPEAAPTPAAPAPPATRTQAGRVLDENGRPLVGATIMLKGSTKGTSTDATGSYSLEVPGGDNTFVVGYGGYQDETATAHDGQPLNVTLLPTPGRKTKGSRGPR